VIAPPTAHLRGYLSSRSFVGEEKEKSKGNFFA
jgi:hypothetical protein